MPDNDALRPIDTRNRIQPATGGKGSLKRHPSPQPEQQDKPPPEDDPGDDDKRHGGRGDGHIDEYA